MNFKLSGDSLVKMASDLYSSDLRVFLVLLAMSEGKRDIFNAAADEIMEVLCLSRPTVSNAIRVLDKKGYVKLASKRRGCGNNTWLSVVGVEDLCA